MKGKQNPHYQEGEDKGSLQLLGAAHGSTHGRVFLIRLSILIGFNNHQFLTHRFVGEELGQGSVRDNFSVLPVIGS